MIDRHTEAERKRQRKEDKQTETGKKITAYDEKQQQLVNSTRALVRPCDLAATQEFLSKEAQETERVSGDNLCCSFSLLLEMLG